MTKLLLASVAGVLAALGAAQGADLKPVPMLKAPAAAPPQASGYIEAYTGWATTANSETEVFSLPPVAILTDETSHGWVLGGAGRGNYWLAPNASVQIDAQAEGTSYSVTTGSTPAHFSTQAYLIGAHINWRDSQRGLFGLFGGAGDAGGNGNFSNVRHGLFGGEGQLYWSQLTLYLQGGYDTTVSPIDGLTDNVHAWFVRGTGRYFIEQNLMFEGTGLYANGATDFTPSSAFGPQDFNTWLWQAKLEWRPAMSPFSFFAKYQGSQTQYPTTTFTFFPGSSDTLTQKVTDNRFLLGLRLYLGPNGLQINDRSAATLDIIDPLGTAVSPVVFQSFRQMVQ